MKSGIYILVNQVTGKQYVGSSKRLRRRECQHWRELVTGKHKNRRLQHSYNVHGKHNFAFVIVELCAPDPRYLIERENWWIDLLGTLSPSGYNLIKADMSEFSQETKNKFKGRISPMAGRHHTNATKAMLSAALTGRTLTPQHIQNAARGLIGNKGRTGQPLPPEHRAKISAANKGKPGPMRGRTCSAETKEKMSAANKGNIPWNKGKTGVYSQETRDRMSLSHKGRRYRTKAKEV